MVIKQFRYHFKGWPCTWRPTVHWNAWTRVVVPLHMNRFSSGWSHAATFGVQSYIVVFVNPHYRRRRQDISFLHGQSHLCQWNRPRVGIFLGGGKNMTRKNAQHVFAGQILRISLQQTTLNALQFPLQIGGPLNCRLWGDTDEESIKLQKGWPVWAQRSDGIDISLTCRWPKLIWSTENCWRYGFNFHHLTQVMPFYIGEDGKDLFEWVI
jgi:hypothetical protein